MNDAPILNRRQFLINTGQAATTLAAASTFAPAVLAAEAPGRTIGVGCIGLGTRGGDLNDAVAHVPNVKVVAVCDTYPATLRRAAEAAGPQAEKFDDYKKLLDKKEVQAVVIATPTHQHKDIVIAALQAGKHVYCEAPLASSIEDAKTIAQAAKAAPKLVFQSGLQARSHPQRQFLLPFIRGGAAGRNVMARAQWHKKDQWRRTSPNGDREKDLNWRLDRAISTGLMGEIGIHQIDAVSWFLNDRPTAVTGFNSLVLWKDGRTVPDTIQAVFEYAGKSQSEGMTDSVHFMYDATLCNSFDSEYEIYFGTDAAVMTRDDKAWMFKEADAPLLGWEVYARKDLFYTESGVALVADATKQTAIGKTAAGASAYPYSAVYYALGNFTENITTISKEVENFVSLYGDDPIELQKDLAALKLKPEYKPAAGWQEGLEATVLAIKANEAVVNNQKIVLQKEWFEL